MEKLIKIDRFLAWVLFAGMLLYFISGYGITKGIISPTLATSLHLKILTYAVFLAFLGHTSFAIHLAFKRWQIWNSGAKAFIVIFFLSLLTTFIYIDAFYKKSDNNSDNKVSATDVIDSSWNASVSSSVSSSTTKTTQKNFTLSELAKYDGLNGQSAYVAVDGNVYDLSSVFRSGTHFSHYAGKELTNAFYSQHAKQILEKYPIVGKLVK